MHLPLVIKSPNLTNSTVVVTAHVVAVVFAAVVFAAVVAVVAVVAAAAATTLFIYFSDLSGVESHQDLVCFVGFASLEIRN